MIAAAVVHGLAPAIEAAAGLTLVGHAAVAALGLLRGGSLEAARLILANGAVLALSLVSGAALRKTVALPDRERSAMPTALLARRTVL